MQTAAFALFGSTRLARGMMGQQLPVGLYRSASVDGRDMVEGQCPWMNLMCHEGREGRGSKGWREKQIAKYEDRTSAHQWNRLLTAESVEISNKDSGVTLNKL